MEVKYNKCMFLRENPEKDLFPADLELGMGDHVAKVLNGMGITKERWADVVNSYSGKKKGCGCSHRQDFLNWAGEFLGFSPGVNSKLQKAIASMTVETQRVYGCELHGKCIGRHEFADDILKNIKQHGIQPCQHCRDFKRMEGF